MPLSDERGYVQHFIKDTNKPFDKIREVYFSTVYNGVVKGWHYHKEMSMNYLCVYGMIKLVLYDNRESSTTKGLVNEFFIGEKNPVSIFIPKMIWNGFKGYGERDFSIVANVTDVEHRKDEIIREPPFHGNFDVIYNWNRKDS